MRTIKPSKVHHAGKGVSRDPNHYRIAKDAASRLSRVYETENVARCHRCPVKVRGDRLEGSFCPTCDGLNRTRIQLGLIRPRYQGDHANNILYAIPITKKGKVRTPPARRYGRACSRLVGGRVRTLRGGWYQAVVTLDSFVIEEGPKVRSNAAAVSWMQTTMGTVSENLAMGISYDV